MTVSENSGNLITPGHRRGRDDLAATSEPSERSRPSASYSGVREKQNLLADQALRTVSDMARGLSPRTVMHALLEHRKRALDVEDLMALTGKTAFEVEQGLQTLESEGWLVFLVENGITKYIIKGADRRH